MTDVDRNTLALELRTKLETKLIEVNDELDEIRQSEEHPDWKKQQEEVIGTIFTDLTDALERIDAGTYGVCATCGNEIDEGWLRSLPHIRDCRDCTGTPDTDAHPQAEKKTGILERARKLMGLKEDGSEDGSEVVEEPLSVEELQKKFNEAAADDYREPWTPPPAPDAPGWDGENATARTDEKKFADIPLPGMHKGQVRDVPLDKIRPAPDNDRESMDEEKLKELAESIVGVGTLLQRLALTPVEGTDEFEIIDGHRRFAALTTLGWEFAPSEIFDRFTAAQMHAARFIANLQRDDLTPLEEAKALSRLINEYGYGQRELSRTIGMPQPTMSKRLALLDLTPKAREHFQNGVITQTQALELLKLKDHPKKLDEVLQQHIELKWDIAGSVKREVAEVDRLAKVAAAKKKLEDEGVPLRDNGYNADLRPLGKRVGQLSVDAKLHATEPCHAAEIDHNGRVTLVCTDWKRHRPKAGESDVKGKVIEQPKPKGASIPGLSEEEIAEQSAWKEANEARSTFVKELLGGRVPKDDVSLLMAQTFIHADFEVAGALNEVAALLDLAPKNQGTRPTVIPVLKEFLSMKDGNPSKLLLAIAIRYYEMPLEDDDWRKDVAEVSRPYFELLVRHGYTLSEVETAYLEPKEGAAQ